LQEKLKNTNELLDEKTKKLESLENILMKQIKEEKLFQAVGFI